MFLIADVDSTVCMSNSSIPSIVFFANAFKTKAVKLRGAEPEGYQTSTTAGLSLENPAYVNNSLAFSALPPLPYFSLNTGS